ncbi:hypothetical protein LTR17_012133 [Elasticomyces elasticus]|nr:hypothetical protein LTR17_012133 [Elasticomyces elasticus]
MRYIVQTLAVGFGLLAALPCVRSDANTGIVCYSDNARRPLRLRMPPWYKRSLTFSQPSHFRDPITEFSGADLQAIITSLQQNNLNTIGGNQPNNSVFELPGLTNHMIEYVTTRVCIQSPDIVGNNLDFDQLITALQGFVAQCCSDTTASCAGGGTSVTGLGTGSIRPGSANIWIHNHVNGINNDCLNGQDVTQIQSWTIAGQSSFTSGGITGVSQDIVKQQFTKADKIGLAVGGPALVALLAGVTVFAYPRMFVASAAPGFAVLVTETVDEVVDPVSNIVLKLGRIRTFANVVIDDVTVSAGEEALFAGALGVLESEGIITTEGFTAAGVAAAAAFAAGEAAEGFDDLK